MLKITKWSSLQSYKDRKPPWIRLHKTLLDNYEFHNMSANARALLPMLWLLASEDEDPVSGAIRYGYEKIAFRLRLSPAIAKTTLTEIEKNGFIEQYHLCTETVTEPLQNNIKSVTPETETETETEKIKSRRFTPPSVDDVSQYCTERKNQINPQSFIDFYSAKGWLIGKTPMKDWQAAVRTWEARQRSTTPTPLVKKDKLCACGGKAAVTIDNEPKCRKCLEG